MHFFRLPLYEQLLRAGVAFSFLFPPLSALGDPYAWIGYFPGFLVALSGGQEIILLHIFGVIEVVLALWILFGKRIVIPSAVAVFLLLGIVLFNIPLFDTLFRDISIALMAAALAVLHFRNHGN